MSSPVVLCALCDDVLELEGGRCKSCRQTPSVDLKVVEDLLPIEMAILVARYGWEKPSQSLDQVAKRLGISRVYARQCEAKALAWLKRQGFRRGA